MKKILLFTILLFSYDVTYGANTAFDNPDYSYIQSNNPNVGLSNQPITGDLASATEFCNNFGTYVSFTTVTINAQNRAGFNGSSWYYQWGTVGIGTLICDIDDGSGTGGGTGTGSGTTYGDITVNSEWGEQQINFYGFIKIIIGLFIILYTTKLSYRYHTELYKRLSITSKRLYHKFFGHQ